MTHLNTVIDIHWWKCWHHLFYWSRDFFVHFQCRINWCEGRAHSGAKIFHFHAVFGNNWPNNRLAPPGKSWIRHWLCKDWPMWWNNWLILSSGITFCTLHRYCCYHAKMGRSLITPDNGSTFALWVKNWFTKTVQSLQRRNQCVPAWTLVYSYPTWSHAKTEVNGRQCYCIIAIV